MKYTLDTSSKKFICPNCKKKRFVRYIENETNRYLNEIYGRCDRETSCGYLNKPINNIANNFTSISKNNKTKLKSSIYATFHSKSHLQLSLQRFDNNNLYLYLLTMFTEEKVIDTFNNYRIGTSKAWSGATVFWQIDNEDNIRAGKIMLLDKSTCKRVKAPYNHIIWVHSALKLESFELNQCLFGLHLAKQSEKIAITESEKTAIIMSLFMPEYTWLSTGSKQNFKYEILSDIKEKDIIAFPDKNEFEYWTLKATELNKLGFKIKVSDYVEKINCESGTDLADIYISLKNKTYKIEDLPSVEKEIIKLSKLNINLLQLIESFDLLDKFHNQIDLEKLKLLM